MVIARSIPSSAPAVPILPPLFSVTMPAAISVVILAPVFLPYIVLAAVSVSEPEPVPTVMLSNSICLS